MRKERRKRTTKVRDSCINVLCGCLFISENCKLLACLSMNVCCCSPCVVVVADAAITVVVLCLPCFNNIFL